MPDTDEKQFESYLKSFRPVDPEPLPLGGKTHSVGARRRSALAVTAVACMTAIALVLIVSSHNQQNGNDQPASHTFSNSSDNVKPTKISAPVLTRLALDDHQSFDEFMSEKVQSQFPPMKSEQSALRVLAKE
jgi:hypothetical protein